MEVIKLIKQLDKCYNADRVVRDSKGNLLALIMPHVEIDVDMSEDDICIDYLSGDGFAFMLDDRGVSVEEMIGRIQKLNKGEKVKLSELVPYL